MSQLPNKLRELQNSLCGQKVMIFAQVRILAGPHNLLVLRGPDKIRTCAKRALLDRKSKFCNSLITVIIPLVLTLFSLKGDLILILEFIGEEWFRFLKRAKIPFIIRIKKNTMAGGIRDYY